MQAEMKQLDNRESRKGILKSDVLVGNSRKWVCLESQALEENWDQIAFLKEEVTIAVKFPSIFSSQTRSTSWSRLVYHNNYWLDWPTHFFFQHSWFPEDEACWLLWSPDFSYHNKVHICSVERNISTITGWIPMKFGTELHVPFRISCMTLVTLTVTTSSQIYNLSNEHVMLNAVKVTYFISHEC